MRRARWLLLAMTVAGCANFEKEVADYERRTADAGPAPEPKKALGSPCTKDTECKSNFCTDGFCREGQSGPNQSCNSASDCQSGLFCEPAADLYLCLQAQCPVYGRLCQGDFACGGVGCLALKCRDGLCGPPDCTAGAACQGPADCCDGFGCSMDGGCQPVTGKAPDGYRCTSAAHCTSGECLGSGLCGQTPSSKRLGESCSETEGCAGGLACEASRCCLLTSRACSSNDECCSNQCLDGTCAHLSACRDVGLPCGDADDCCSGATCNTDRQRCAGPDGGF